MKIFESKPNGKYIARRKFSADDVLHFATELVTDRFKRGETMSSPAITKQLLCLQLADRFHEVFGILFLDSQHRLISNEELFHGTIDSASIHPRVIVQRSLQLNAAALILYHKHPSGIPEPSTADRAITHSASASQALSTSSFRARSLDEYSWLSNVAIRVSTRKLSFYNSVTYFVVIGFAGLVLTLSDNDHN